MNTETLNKIERDIISCLDCIKHWTENSLGLTSDKGPASCAFCKMYNSLGVSSMDCKRCPIFEKTGKKICKGTPYEKFIDTHDLFAPSDKNLNITKFQEYSTEEVLFLSEILNDLIKKRDKLRKEIDSIKVGVYVRIKIGIKKEDVWNQWPDCEAFPNTIFKVTKIENDRFYTLGYSSSNRYKKDCPYQFSISQFEKIDVIIEPGVMVANINDYKKYNVRELNVKYNDKTFVICKELNSGELVAIEEENLTIIKF